MVQLHSLLKSLDHSSSSPRATSPRRQALSPAPTIISPLPGEFTLEKDAAHEARLAQRRHLLEEAVASPLVLPSDAYPTPSEEQLHSYSTLPSGRAPTKTARSRGGGGNYESWQVLKSIEKKDVMALMDIKTSQFDLLLTGTPLPIVYAMRLGKTHQDIAILLIGAMSRKVNDVTDDELEMMNPQTKATLRALRASLKIAINASLASSDTSLIASFLQVVIMSEGSRWLLSSSQTLSLAFRTGPSAHPIETAEKSMLSWVSRELKEAQVSAVGDYTANGIWDLCLLGLWSVVTDQLGSKVEPLPLYFFGRDDRMLKAVEERIAVLKAKGNWTKLTKPIRTQLDIAIEILGQRQVNGRERVEKLKEALDA
ncbi:uncharacterized protein JCM6883_003539 [Sporobolomyces salmoneus]|uniref:uncharacterized protein n=1 Tax=Sporobolomyces salmoneus TaxID=183962 RepID=UPI003171B078